MVCIVMKRVAVVCTVFITRVEGWETRCRFLLMMSRVFSSLMGGNSCIETNWVGIMYMVLHVCIPFEVISMTKHILSSII